VFPHDETQSEEMTMNTKHNIPQLTELDRLLLSSGGWSCAEAADMIRRAAEPRQPGRLRAHLVVALRALAQRLDATDGHARSAGHGINA
jgi:hypothetical protein